MNMDHNGGAHLPSAPPTSDAQSFTNPDAASSFRSHRRSRASRASERETIEESIHRYIQSLKLQVDAERRRAENAERKVQEVTSHLKAVNDARLEALREAGRAKEELRLYKIQLDAAQKEIYRAQDVIGIVDQQRHTAEKEAARNRTKTRQLKETILIQSAREEAFRLGMKEGLDRGRAIAYAERPYTAYDDDYSYSEESETVSTDPSRRHSGAGPSRHSHHHSQVEPHSQVPLQQLPSHAAPSVRAPSMRGPSPIPPDAPPQPQSTYAPSMRGPSPNLSHAPPQSNYAPSMRGPSPNPPPQSNYAPSMRGPSPNPSNAPPRSNYAPSMRGPSPNPSHAPPANNYAPSMRAPSPNPSNAPPRSNYAPSMRGPSPNPSNAPPRSNYAPSMRAPSPNQSNAPPRSNYASSMRAPSPNPSNAPPGSNYAPSMRGPSPSPSNALPRSNYAPSVRAPSPNPSNAAPQSNYMPSMRAPSPNPSQVRAPSNYVPSRAPSINLSERMARPESVLSATPTPYHPPIVVPPDNLIPTLDADMRIRLPPPHEFATRTPEPNMQPPLPAMSESSHTSQDPLPVLPRTGPGIGPAPSQRSSRHRRGSSSGSSTALSQLELFSNPYPAGLRTPMSIIEEVNSQTASPNHQRSFSENSPIYPPSAGGGGHSMSRQPSRASYNGSWMQQQQPMPAESASYHSGDAPNISVQPPSLSNKSESQRGLSPAPSHRSSRHAPPAHGMPGENNDFYQPSGEPPVVPIVPLRRPNEPRHPDLQNRRSLYGGGEEDAVSSALTADTLTTPHMYRQNLPDDGHGWT